MDKVNLVPYERLDISDAQDLQELVYTYITEVLFGLLGPPKYGGALSVFKVDVPTSGTTLTVHDGWAFVVSYGYDPPLAVNKSYILRYSSNDPGQTSTVDVGGVPNNSVGVVWVSSYSYLESGSRVLWDPTAQQEVVTSITTRKRSRVQFTVTTDTNPPNGIDKVGWAPIFAFYKDATGVVTDVVPTLVWDDFEDVVNQLRHLHGLESSPVDKAGVLASYADFQDGPYPNEQPGPQYDPYTSDTHTVKGTGAFGLVQHLYLIRKVLSQLTDESSFLTWAKTDSSLRDVQNTLTKVTDDVNSVKNQTLDLMSEIANVGGLASVTPIAIFHTSKYTTTWPNPISYRAASHVYSLNGSFYQKYPLEITSVSPNTSANTVQIKFKPVVGIAYIYPVITLAANYSDPIDENAVPYLVSIDSAPYSAGTEYTVEVGVRSGLNNVAHAMNIALNVELD